MGPNWPARKLRQDDVYCDQLVDAVLAAAPAGWMPACRLMVLMTDIDMDVLTGQRTLLAGGLG